MVLCPFCPKRKSGAGAPLELHEVAIGFRDDCHEVIASLSPSRERIATLLKMAEELREGESAAAACLQKLSGKLGFVQTAAAGHCGGAALRPLHELIAGGGGSPTK